MRLTWRDRFLSWIVTGPVGRFVAFSLDLGAAWWGWARRRLGIERAEGLPPQG